MRARAIQVVSCVHCPFYNDDMNSCCWLSNGEALDDGTIDVAPSRCPLRVIPIMVSLKDPSTTIVERDYELRKGMFLKCVTPTIDMGYAGMVVQIHPEEQPGFWRLNRIVKDRNRDVGCVRYIAVRSELLRKFFEPTEDPTKDPWRHP